MAVTQIVNRHFGERTHLQMDRDTITRLSLQASCLLLCLALGLDSVGEDKVRKKQANVSQA